MLKKPYSILVVEDEDIIRTSLREFLSEEGYEVGVAASVASALHQARQRDFDVAICDVQLPDGDGLVLLRRLQQLNPNISGLMISAYATVENAIEAVAETGTANRGGGAHADRRSCKTNDGDGDEFVRHDGFSLMLQPLGPSL